MPSQKNIDIVAGLTEHLKEAQTVVFCDYRGLTVEEITNLRAKLRENNVHFQVAKNRLMRIALKDLGMPTPEDCLIGPSAFSFSVDPVAGPKTLSEFAKDNEKLEIKGGLYGGEVVDVAAVKALADMPSREELLGRLVGDLKSPMTKFALAMKATVNKVAYALQAVADKKQAAEG